MKNTRFNEMHNAQHMDVIHRVAHQGSAQFLAGLMSEAQTILLSII